MLGAGSFEMAMGTFQHAEPVQLAITHPLTLFLLLRAFSSGCTAMTGVEAVSNGVPAFRHPESRNASLTLVAMASILAVMFFGITFFAHYHGVVPSETETVLSALAHAIFHDGPAYYFVQITTMAS